MHGEHVYLDNITIQAKQVENPLTVHFFGIQPIHHQHTACATYSRVREISQ